MHIQTIPSSPSPKILILEPNVNASMRLCVCMNVNDLGIIWASRSTVHTWRCVHTVVFVVTDYAITPLLLETSVPIEWQKN